MLGSRILNIVKQVKLPVILIHREYILNRLMYLYFYMHLFYDVETILVLVLASI